MLEATHDKWRATDEEGVAAMLVALQRKKPNHDRPNGAMLSLTVPEVAEGLDISEDAARALMKAALGNGPGSLLSPSAVLGVPENGS